jgi:MSHA pilin protein MshC
MPAQIPSLLSFSTCRPLRVGLRGFTLIELIMVIVILGVLAVFAAPRLLNTSDFTARGFHDETLSLLRYAQKVAIAQRRTVCVTFTPSSASLTMASTAATFDCATATALSGPKGETPPTVTAKAGVGYSPTPGAFNFDGLGQPIASDGSAKALQIIKITSAGDITVEAGTGYVHD